MIWGNNACVLSVSCIVKKSRATHRRHQAYNELCTQCVITEAVRKVSSRVESWAVRIFTAGVVRNEASGDCASGDFKSTMYPTLDQT